MSLRSSAAGLPIGPGIKYSTTGPLVSPRPDAESVERCAARLQFLSKRSKDVLHTVLAHEDVHGAAAELDAPVRVVLEEAAAGFEAVVGERIPTAMHRECVKQAFAFLAKGGKPDKKYLAVPKPETKPETPVTAPVDPKTASPMPAPAFNEGRIRAAVERSTEFFFSRCPSEQLVILYAATGMRQKQISDKIGARSDYVCRILTDLHLTATSLGEDGRMDALRRISKRVLELDPTATIDHVEVRVLQEPSIEDVVSWIRHLGPHQIKCLGANSATVRWLKKGDNHASTSGYGPNIVFKLGLAQVDPARWWPIIDAAFSLFEARAK